MDGFKIEGWIDFFRMNGLTILFLIAEREGKKVKTKKNSKFFCTVQRYSFCMYQS